MDVDVGMYAGVCISVGVSSDVWLGDSVDVGRAWKE